MANFNFRLFLRPTAVGRILIERLTSDGADRQAEARRWIELGYMCEQAGFRLDGATLFQAGRPAAADQVSARPVLVHSLPASAVVAADTAPAVTLVPAPQPVFPAQAAQQSVPSPAEAQAPSSASFAPVERPVEPARGPVASTASQPAPPAPASSLDSEMTANLRNLAH